MNSMSWRRSICFAFIMLLWSSVTSGCAYGASASASESELDALTLEIMHKQIAFEEANLNFQLNSQFGRLKAWRFFASQEAAAGLIEGGLIAQIVCRRHQMEHQGRIRGVLLEGALIPQMVGQSIGATGDVLELGLNARRLVMAHHRKTNWMTVKRHAIKLHQELTALLQKRADLVAEIYGSNQLPESVPAVETALLQNHEHLLWWQFSQSLMGAKSVAATQNCFYALDLLKNASGAAGNLVGIDSTHLGVPHVNLGANILTTISGGLIAANPFLSRYAGQLISRPFRSGLDYPHRDTLASTVGAVANDTATLRRLMTKDGSNVDVSDEMSLTKAAIYDQQLVHASSRITAEREENRVANRAALGQRGVGIVVGGTKITTGITGIIGAEHLKPSAGASLLMDGSIAYAGGTALTIEENLRLVLKRELTYRRDRGNHSRPADILARQIEELQAMDMALSNLSHR